MKKLFLLILAAIAFNGTAQENKEKIPALSMNGGLWFGLNKTTNFVGFIGPKFSATFPMSENLKVETGLNGIPGLVLGNNLRLGLAAGATVTVRHNKSRLKPVLGVMFLKTDKWQTLYGIGFLF